MNKVNKEKSNTTNFAFRSGVFLSRLFIYHLKHICCFCTSLLQATSFVFLDLSDVQGVSDPLLKIKPGLQIEGSGSEGQDAVPLQGVHVRARLLDLAAQVRKTNK